MNTFICQQSWHNLSKIMAIANKEEHHLNYYRGHMLIRKHEQILIFSVLTAKFLLLFPLTVKSTDLLYEEIPIVLTPTRLEQSLADTPASVTVINREMIAAIGARKITDALRFVPGMIVHTSTGNDIEVAYHSGNDNRPRRLQALIDGIPVYRPDLAEVDWSAFPVSIEDIERIEITRSPSTPAYGANAFNGVINIITKHPDGTQNLNVKYLAGPLSTQDILLNYSGGFGSTNYRITLDEQKDKGVDLSTFDKRTGRDDTLFQRLNIRASTSIDEKNELEFFLIENKGEFEIEAEARNLEELTKPDISKRQSIFSTQLTSELNSKSQLKFKLSNFAIEQRQSWIACAPLIFLTEEAAELFRLSPDITSEPDDIEEAIRMGQIPPTQTPEEQEAINNLIARIISLGGPVIALSDTCGRANQDFDQERLNFEVQNTYVFSDSLRIVSALGFANSKGRSETYLGGEASDETSFLLTNLEYKPSGKITINAGAIWENGTDLDTEFSPRLGLNYHFNSKHTLRFIHSEAVRTPDLFEKKANWKYFIRDLTVPIDGSSSAFFAAQAASSTVLMPERIIANEISYYANLPQHGLSLDFKLFDEKQRDLIARRLIISEFDLSNSESTDIKGLETEIHYKPNSKIDILLAYSHFDIDASTEREIFLSARETISMLATYSFSPQWQATFTYIGVQPERKLNQWYKRSELIINSNHPLTEYIRLKTSLKIQHYTSDDSFNEVDLFNDDTRYFLGLSLDIGF